VSKSRTDKYSLPIHRLVAKAFIPNPNNFPQVNHIDGNKKNNCVSNLEWCDNSYNQIHASALKLNDHTKYDTGRKKVAQISDDLIINIFDSMADAARKTNSFRELIGKCCRKERITHNGYRWVFATEDMKVGDVISFN